jgi:uncharacterized glyoxalase superfamily protein PhnB
VVDDINDDETYQRIVSSISFWLDQQDVLLLASMLNTYFPPADPYDVAECLDESVFTVIFNPLTQKLEWESDSTRYIAAGEWTDGDNAFGYRPPDRILLAALEFDGTHIQFIDSPTEEMKLAAVQRTSAAIKYIENPSDAVRRAAATTATFERPHVRAAFARKYGPAVEPTKAGVNDGTPCKASRNVEMIEAQDEPEYWVQGIGPLNLFSDLLICTVMELNSHIGNDERAADFVHVKEVDGALVLSFSSIRQLFSLRDVFREMAEMKGIEDDSEMDFDGMSVIEYPKVAGRGFITWGPAAPVSR